MDEGKSSIVRICMLNITSGGMSGGYKTYLANLIPRLAAHPEVSGLLVGVPQGIDLPGSLGTNGSVQWLPMGCPSLPIGPQVGDDERKVIERFAPDVLFVPTSRFWSLGSVPVVNMVRNMMPMTAHNSRYCLERARNWARFRQMRAAVERSKRVIAISQFVKDYLTGELGIAEDRVGVVYHGSEPSSDRRATKPEGIPDEWSGRFVFTAGLIYPYRGLEDQIEAWRHLRDLPNLPPLVIAGKVGQGMSRYYGKLQRLVQEKGLHSHIHFVGVLTASEMAWCYRHCSCLIMSSRVEACPNIALEAMAHGCLCISSDKPPMPEIFGNTAKYYPAGNAGILAERLLEVLHLLPPQREEMKIRAAVRAAGFTWEACCNQTVEELHKAIQ